MAAYLTDHPPVRDQWYAKRNRPLTGCTVLHTAEGVMDTVGPDTGAEAIAEFIRTRTTPGSYHDLVDSDSWIRLVELGHAAYHDGTGSNNWALSISFACRTSDWRRMTPERRAGFLRQGARAFVAQQAYRRAIGAPLTELRLITKAASDRGESGFTYHGLRDPGRRTDPGVHEPDLFPIAEFLTHCRAALAGTTTTTPTPEDDMRNLMLCRDTTTGKVYASNGIQTRWVSTQPELDALQALIERSGGDRTVFDIRHSDLAALGYDEAQEATGANAATVNDNVLAVQKRLDQVLAALAALTPQA